MNEALKDLQTRRARYNQTASLVWKKNELTMPEYQKECKFRLKGFRDVTDTLTILLPLADELPIFVSNMIPSTKGPHNAEQQYLYWEGLKLVLRGEDHFDFSFARIKERSVRYYPAKEGEPLPGGQVIFINKVIKQHPRAYLDLLDLLLPPFERGGYTLIPSREDFA